MLSPLQNYFHYSRGERRGTIALLIIIVLLLGFYFVSDHLFTNDRAELDLEEFKEKIASFEQEKISSVTADSVAYFMFDPNVIGVDDWKLLGFTQKQAESIENYKSSGAIFKIKKDLLKLFMVDEYKYAQLEPYIDLPEEYPYSESNYKDYSEFDSKSVFAILLKESDTPIYSGFEDLENVHYGKKNGVYQYCIFPFEDEQSAEFKLSSLDYAGAKVIELTSTKGYYPIAKKDENGNEAGSFEKLTIDLNNADTTELKKLYGIGSGYAKRIVKYREALGGFVDLDQLGEVYGLKQETIDKILPNVYLGNRMIQKIDINTATVEELKVHPYIEWKVANSIVQIRNNYGKFASIDGILKSVLIDEELFQKIKPYIEAK